MESTSSLGWSDYEWIVVLGGIGCFWSSWTIGANNVGNGESF